MLELERKVSLARRSNHANRIRTHLALIRRPLGKSCGRLPARLVRPLAARDRAWREQPIPLRAILRGTMPDEPTTADPEELTQRFVDALNVGDIDVAMNLYASDVVVEGAMQTLEGRDAVRGWTQDWRDAFDDFELTTEEVRDLGNGVTFGVSISRGRPRGGAGWVQFRYGVVNTWVDGLVRRSTFYLDIDEARAAAERLAQERG